MIKSDFPSMKSVQQHISQVLFSRRFRYEHLLRSARVGEGSFFISKWPHHLFHEQRSHGMIACMKKVILRSANILHIFDVVSNLEREYVFAFQLRTEVRDECLLALNAVHLHERLIPPLLAAE